MILTEQQTVSPIMDTHELFGLSGRVALATGDSRGLGRLIAAGLLAQGAKVRISSREGSDCDATAEEPSKIGPCMASPTDASTIDGVRKLARMISGRESRLDVSINNAGAAWTVGFENFPGYGWDKVFDLDLKAPFFLTRALQGPLRHAARTRPAKVVNIASMGGLSAKPRESYSHSGAKAGLAHITWRI
jgi:NAD(P)-dependent dehydrogenase (short-subunit alcohol dehydrogenase family)